MSDRFESFQFENVMKLTQDTSSKIIKRFVPSLARKTRQAQFPASETNQLRKPQRGNCQKREWTVEWMSGVRAVQCAWQYARAGHCTEARQ